LNFKEMNEVPSAIAAIDFCSDAGRRIDDARSVRERQKATRLWLDALPGADNLTGQ